MAIFIALLRGINVGGQKKIVMASLKELFGKLGFHNVTTYIQSGNVVFRSFEKDSSKIAKSVEKGIRDRYSYDVGVIVKSLDELSETIRTNPFNETDLGKGEKIYFTLLFQKPAKETVSMLKKFDNEVDDLAVKEKTVYLLCRKGYGRSMYSNNFIEKVLKVKATTRNLETMKKLVEIGNSLK